MALCTVGWSDRVIQNVGCVQRQESFPAFYRKMSLLLLAGFSYLSSDQNPGWLGYINIGDYTTQLCRDYNKAI